MDDYEKCTGYVSLCKSFNALEREIELRFNSLEKNMASTRKDLDVRLQSMNEFRAQLDRQSNTFVARAEIDMAHHRLDEKIQGINENYRRLANKSSEQTGSAKWSDYIITAIIAGIVAALVSLIK